MDIKNQYGTLEMQLYELENLKDFDTFCRQHNICYSLAGGTLLGAVRHGGFIPWDDDIDVMLDRVNYEKFLQEAESSLPEKYEFIQRIWIKRITRKDNPKKDKEEGCIDLFVVDNVPDNPVFSKLKIFMILTLQGMLKGKVDYSKYSFKNKILLWGTYVIGLPFTRHFKQKMYDTVSKIGNGKNTKNVNCYNTMFKYVRTCRYSRDMLSSYHDIEFENCMFMAMEDYNQHLKEQYGDYMQLPPEGERIPMHMK